MRRGLHGDRDMSFADALTFHRNHVLAKAKARGSLPTRRSLPCVYEIPLTILDACPLNNPQRHVRQCEIHGPCVREPRAVDARLCQTCGDYAAGTRPIVPVAQPVESLVAKFDEFNSHPGFPGKRFNPAMIPWGEGYALLWRSGWAGSNLFISYLDSDFKPRGMPIPLKINHPRAKYGREDPRFFTFRDKLHVSFSGVESVDGKIFTNCLYARLDESFQVEEVFYPVIQGRKSWEKNHVFFEHEGQLHAVYTTSPHRILKIDGEKTAWAYQTQAPLPWRVDGEIRGGVSPVRVGDEWWHFFHSRIECDLGVEQMAKYYSTPKPDGSSRQYCMGLLTFEAEPPFRILRITPEPIMWADWETKPRDQYCAAVFPCGAVRAGDEWLISMGIHDRWAEIHRFSHAGLESKLVDV
jgi:predicted GH43/DUF377 family glycosyl hydrolase